MFAWMPSEREEVSSETIDLVAIIAKQKLCKLCQKKKKKYWFECHRRGLRKHLIACIEFYNLGCPPPTGPASSCRISPDHKTLLKAIGQSSERVFQETWDRDKNEKQNSSTEGLERHHLTKSISTFQATSYCQDSYKLYDVSRWEHQTGESIKQWQQWDGMWKTNSGG